MSDADVDEMSHPNRFRSLSGGAQTDQIDGAEGLLNAEEVERRYYRALLEMFEFNRSEVARVAGLPRTTVLRRLRELGLLSSAPRARAPRRQD